jgi:hypothetical protein
MKATLITGTVCLALCSAVAYAQQPEQLVAWAMHTDADAESSSLARFSPTLRSTAPATEPALQVATGNAWLSSTGWRAPAVSESGSCSQLQLAALTESAANGLALRNFSLHGEFTREHMVKVARDFVPGQQLPDAPSYTPLTSKQKFEGWARHTYSFDMLEGVGFDALILQATGGYRDDGGGMGGYGKRYGATLLSAEASSLFGRWLFPTLLHQDPRYFPSHQSNIFDRMAYAASRTLITRSDDGRNVVNTSLLMTLLVSSALANGYRPNYEGTFGATMANAAAGLGTTAQMNLLNEFWPDLKSFFLHHEPKSAKFLERKINDLSSDEKGNRR